MLKVLVYDKVFLICAALDFALIWGSHYMMERHGWCAEGISLCGRYLTGTLTIMSASTAWYFTHLGTTATEMITIVWLFLFIAGAATLFFYLIDAYCDKKDAEADLREFGLAVSEG